MYRVLYDQTVTNKQTNEGSIGDDAGRRISEKTKDGAEDIEVVVGAAGGAGGEDADGDASASASASIKKAGTPIIRTTF